MTFFQPMGIAPGFMPRASRRATGPAARPAPSDPVAAAVRDAVLQERAVLAERKRLGNHLRTHGSLPNDC